MANQERSPVRRGSVETTLVRYVVLDRANRRSSPPDTYESLAEAVDAYAPDAELDLLIGDRVIVMDVGRDMYGLHRDLLRILEQMLRGEPGPGLYLDALGPNAEKRVFQTLVLTDHHHPPVVFFSRRDGVIDVETRTLVAGRAVALDDDTTIPIAYDERDLVHNCCSFLREFMRDLAGELPAAGALEEYGRYLARLDAVEATIGAPR